MTSKTAKKPASRSTRTATGTSPARKPASKPKATSAKSAAKAATQAGPVPAPAPSPAPVVVTEKVPTASAPDLRKQELLAKVVSKSGVAKRDAKPVVEAMLDLMAEALRDGRDLNLNPMGKIIIKKSKPVSNGTVLTTRVRLKQKMPKT